MTLIGAHIRLGIHPGQWKTARGGTIPKPGKDYYELAKLYRVISLLNCLGKMVEKVAAMLGSAHYEATRRFHSTGVACESQPWARSESPSRRHKRLGAADVSPGPS